MSVFDLQLSTADALKFCHSMGMILASPADQMEFKDIREMLLKARNRLVNFEQVLIDGYRSELSKNVWISQGNEINYTIRFAKGQPDNYKLKENCLVFFGFSMEINDISCSMPSQFLCEQNNFTKSLKKEHFGDSQELFNFVTPFLRYETISKSNQTSVDVFKSQKFLKVSWIDAHAICRLFGMDMLTSEIFTRKILNNSEVEKFQSHFFVGETDIGSNGFWYSFGIEKVHLNRSDEGNFNNIHHCMIIQQKNGNVQYRKVNCALTKTNFLCQKSSIEMLPQNDTKNENSSIQWLQEVGE